MDCFAFGVVEGFVTLEGCERYKIKVSQHIFGGKEMEEHAEYVYPPVNGTPTMLGGMCKGVVKV